MLYVIHAMQIFHGVADLEREACRALVSLCDSNLENSAIAMENSAVNAVVKMMDHHRIASDMQTYGCWALMNMYGSAKKNSQTYGCDPLKAVVNAMIEHRDDVGVQEMGCIALGNMCYANSDNKRRAAVVDAIKTVVQTMNQHSDNANIQKYGCSALTTICCKSKDNIRDANENEAIITIITAMRNHDGVMGVQEDACRTLIVLCSNVAIYKRSAGAEGAIDAIVTAMKLHSTSCSVQELGCWALHRICSEEVQNISLAVSINALDIVASAIEQHPSTEDVALCLKKILQDGTKKENMQLRDELRASQNECKLLLDELTRYKKQNEVVLRQVELLRSENTFLRNENEGTSFPCVRNTKQFQTKRECYTVLIFRDDEQYAGCRSSSVTHLRPQEESPVEQYKDKSTTPTRSIFWRKARAENCTQSWYNHLRRKAMNGDFKAS